MEKLTACYARIHAAAPNATIVVAGYPKLFDPEGCLQFTPLEAWALNFAVGEFNKELER